MIDCSKAHNKQATKLIQTGTHKHKQAMILEQMHMHYTKDYTLRLSKCSGADEEAKEVASGIADSKTPDGQGGEVREAGGH